MSSFDIPLLRLSICSAVTSSTTFGGNANAFSELAKKKDLLVVPGAGFGCPEYFRICYCVRYEMIQKSLPVFEELIREVNG